MELGQLTRVSRLLAEAERLGNAHRAGDTGDYSRARTDVIRAAFAIKPGDFDAAMRLLGPAVYEEAVGEGEVHRDHRATGR